MPPVDHTEAVKQTQNRFSLEDPIYAAVQCLDPRNAANLQPKSLSKLFDVLPQLSKFADKQMTDEE